MQTFNYHMHTKRCGHATGEDREYIEAAIQAGFTHIGFSEHMAYPGWDDPKERIFYAEIDEYLGAMQTLREEYKDRINIKIGFEFEFFEDYLDHINEMKSKVDYLIVGQHAMNFKKYYEHGSTDDDIDVYASQIIQALDLNLTKYVAHIDYFMLGVEKFSKQNARAVEHICDAVVRNDAFIEINLKGSKYGKRQYPRGEDYIYPHYDVFRIVADKGCKVVFGYDAHVPEAMLERDREMRLREEFKDLDLNIQNEIIL